MNIDGRTYRRAPGSRSILTPCKLLLTDDHLLIVQRGLFLEDHWRLLFRDIQAVLIVRDMHRLAWNTFLGLVMSALLLINLAGVPLHPVLLFFEGLTLLAILVNTGLGASCRVFVKTAVQQKRLPGIIRLPRAMRFLDGIRPALLTAQGQVTDDDLRQQAGLLASQPPLPTVSYAQAMAYSQALAYAAPSPAKPNRYAGGAHVVLGVLLLLGGGLFAIYASVEESVLLALAALMTLGQLVVAIVAIVKQSGSKLSRGLRVMPGLAIGYAALMYVMQVVGLPLRAARRFSESSMGEGPDAISMVGAALAVVLGAIVLALYVFQRRPRQVEAQPPVAGPTPQAPVASPTPQPPVAGPTPMV